MHVSANLKEKSSDPREKIYIDKRHLEWISMTRNVG